VDRDAALPQLSTRAALEAEREVRLHLGTPVAVAGQRQQQRFNAAEEIAGVQVQDAHARFH
jgi:hypothetical protein